MLPHSIQQSENFFLPDASKYLDTRITEARKEIRVKTKIDRVEDMVEEQRILCDRMMGSRRLWNQWIVPTILSLAALGIAIAALVMR